MHGSQENVQSCSRLARFETCHYNLGGMFECKGKYPTPDEFRDWLKTKHFGELVERWVFDGGVYAFEERPEAAKVLISHLSKQLGTPPENIRVVGSAKLGFSLSPDSF